MCWVSDSGEIPLPNLSFPSSDQSYRRQSRKHLLKKKKKNDAVSGQWGPSATRNPFILRYWLNIKILKNSFGRSPKLKGRCVQVHGVGECTKGDSAAGWSETGVTDRSPERVGSEESPEHPARQEWGCYLHMLECLCPEPTKINSTVVEQIGFPHPQPINIPYSE